MTLSEIRRLFSPAHWVLVLAGLVACLAVIAALAWFATAPGRERQKAAEARAAGAMSAARTEAAKDAIGIVVQQGAREDQIDQATKEGNDEIRSATPNDQYRVSLRAHCMRNAAARDPACVELHGARP